MIKGKFTIKRLPKYVYIKKKNIVVPYYIRKHI